MVVYGVRLRLVYRHLSGDERVLSVLRARLELVLAVISFFPSPSLFSYEVDGVLHSWCSGRTCAFAARVFIVHHSLSFPCQSTESQSWGTFSRHWALVREWGFYFGRVGRFFLYNHW